MAETLVFSVQFPKPCNREFIRTNRDFVRENREFYWSTAAAAAAQAGRACGLIAAWIEPGVDFRRCSRPTGSCRALAHRDPEGRNAFSCPVQAILWMSVILGTAHWLMWTFFNEPYIASNFESVAKLTHFILLLSTTVIVCILFRISSKVEREQFSRLLRPVARLTAWGVVLAGWCHLITWILFGLPSEAAGLEVATKLLLPFFLVAGCMVAWVSGRIFRGDSNDDE